MDNTMVTIPPAESGLDTLKKIESVTEDNITNEESVKRYSAWAKTYDQDCTLIEYNPPKISVEQLMTVVTDRSARILDAAAGTGLGGQLLAKNGYTNVDALDASQEMLNQAKKKNVYQNFICAFMGPNRLPIDSDTYDALVTCASFGIGHAKEDCYEQLIRITKPGGYIVIILNEGLAREEPETWHNLVTRMEELATEQLWAFVKRDYAPLYYDNDRGAVFILQPLEGKNERIEKLAEKPANGSN